MNTNRKLRHALGWMLGIMTAAMVGGWTLARAQARADEAIAAEYRQAISSYTPECHDAFLGALEAGGLVNLLELAGTTNAPAPTIPSRLYAEEILPPGPTQDAARRARDFGRAVAAALEAYGPTLQTPVEAAARVEQFDFLNQLSRWLVEPLGYGNAVIAMEARRLGAVPAVYLAVDSSTTDTQIDQVLAAMPTMWWEPDLQAIRRILNAEAGEEVIQELTGTPQEMSREISWQWGQYVEAERQEFRYSPPSGRIMSELEMFDENHFPHMAVGGPFNYPPEARDFLVFRSSVGYFPTDPPEWWVERRGAWQAYTGLEAAIELAITEHDLRVSTRGTADVYQRATSGTYLDTSSAIRALQERERQRRAAAEAGAAKN